MDATFLHGLDQDEQVLINASVIDEGTIAGVAIHASGGAFFLS